jgi:hypothetical protein
MVENVHSCDCDVGRWGLGCINWFLRNRLMELVRFQDVSEAMRLDGSTFTFD